LGRIQSADGGLYKIGVKVFFQQLTKSTNSNKMLKKPVYMDYNATTPVDLRVLQEMLPWFSENFGNAASRTHVFGWKAAEAVDIARRQIADLIGCSDKEIIFTSGATESNNLALKGVFDAHLNKGNHIITIQTEHKAILDVCEHLENLGASVTYLKPDSNGLISAEEIEEVIRPETILVTVMFANNEIGVIQPITEIAEVCRKNKVIFHTDATQAVGKIETNVQKDGIDLMSFSGHKIYGPKGVGVLYIKKKTNLIAQMDGGKHERGLRSGTLNVPGIVGLGKACKIAQAEMTSERVRLHQLRSRLESNILDNITDSFVHAILSPRLDHLTNICFPKIDGENFLMSLRDLAVSSGSACTSASIEPSHVLKALNIEDNLAYSSIRFSLGRFTTEEEVDFAISYLTKCYSAILSN
jgi:cysteine desulfurase